ncbi:MAG: hypothetical protein IID38_12275 [Planctomycetes bacterium]|nr:hypothetical protein [Planctomycetota bacterium]
MRTAQEQWHTSQTTRDAALVPQGVCPFDVGVDVGYDSILVVVGAVEPWGAFL